MIYIHIIFCNFFFYQIEVQKLLKQNEYLEKTIGDMESELKDAIQDADTSERDARLVFFFSSFFHAATMHRGIMVLPMSVWPQFGFCSIT